MVTRLTARVRCLLQQVEVEVPTEYVGRRHDVEHYVVRLNGRQANALTAGVARMCLDEFPPGTAVHLDDGHGHRRECARGCS